MSRNELKKRFNLDAREGRILTPSPPLASPFRSCFNLDAREGRILTSILVPAVVLLLGFNLDAREGRILTVARKKFSAVA